MVAANLSKVRKEASRLAQANKDAEPNIKIIYWFPHDVEIRLVEIDENTVPPWVVNWNHFISLQPPKKGFVPLQRLPLSVRMNIRNLTTPRLGNME